MGEEVKQIWTLDGEPIYSRWYKDCWTKIRYLEEDKCYYGKIENVDDLVDFEGDTYDSCLQAFYEAVDDYETFMNDVSRATHFVRKS